MTPVLRDATAADIPAITCLYAAEVLADVASYELEPPTVQQMHARWQQGTAAGFPWLVALIDGRLAGYGYTGGYRPRPAYRWTVEDTVYVDAAHRRRGVGRALLQALIDHAEGRGYRQMIAVIGDRSNTGSIALHAACGFRIAGEFPGLGHKFGRWLTNIQMLRALGDGAGSPPQENTA